MNNLSRFYQLDYSVIHTWTVWRRMFQWAYCPPRSTPILASHNKKIQKSVLLQWLRSVWRQQRREFWWPSGGRWRPSGDWKLNQTVCFWSVCNSALGWELSGSDRRPEPGGISSSDDFQRLRENLRMMSFRLIAPVSKQQHRQQSNDVKLMFVFLMITSWRLCNDKLVLMVVVGGGW